MNPICPYCKQVSDVVTGEVIYPHRPDLRSKTFYICPKCMAYVGCHPGTGRPLGSLANEETRTARARVHALFDPIWKSGAMSRKKAYKMLADALDVKKVDCHIGLMSKEVCEKAEKIISKFELHVTEEW